MATNVTKLLCRYMDEHRLDEELCKKVCAVATYVNTPEDSKKIDNSPMPSIIVSASGMATGGRVLHHIKAFGTDERNTILFSGYQAGGTRGAKMMKGEREIKIHGRIVKIRAHVEALGSLSAHADAQEILQWLENFKKPPKEVFIVHGELDAATALKAKIEEKFHWKCSIPEYLSKVDL